jgi:hypothetical protein
MLGSNHFLNLELQGLPILKHHADERPESQPSPLFQGDDAGTKRVALALIVLQR